ncbi:hypothetical protein COCNU_scaffold002825G000010 [Cocos nucifera]|nr:hypothetical protein [Cocos nucifera]
MASEDQTVKADHLREVLRREEEIFVQLRAALTLSKDKRIKVEEKVGTKKERAIEAFKFSKAMEDIKISFAQEAFLEGFEICLGRVAKNFLEVDLDLLIGKPSEKASPSNVKATSPIAEPTPEALGLAVEPEAARNALTSPTTELAEVENL